MFKSMLFNGINVGMQIYFVVCIFDWLIRCMMDYFNCKVFINIFLKEIVDICVEVFKFFDKCVREYKYLEKVEKVDVKWDFNYKDWVQVYINVMFYFFVKNFVL